MDAAFAMVAAAPWWLLALAVACVSGAIAVAVLGVDLWRHPDHVIRAEYARQRRALGFRRRRARIAGQRWSWIERDADRAGAPTVVMLHGYTGSKENWFALARALGRSFRLVAPDLPGWGGSERRPGGDYGYAAEAANVAAFLRETADAPVLLLGHSMGGGIAAVVAADHPRLVAAVGLFSAAGVEFAENRFGLQVLAGGNPFGVHDAASLEHYLSILFHRRDRRPPIPWPATHAVIAHRRLEAAFEQSVLDRIGRGDDRFLPGESASRIRQPALLAWGADDQVIDPSAMAIYAAAMPQARTLLLRDCGHMSLVECAEQLADAVRSLAAAAIPAAATPIAAQRSRAA